MTTTTVEILPFESTAMWSKSAIRYPFALLLIGREGCP